jgi:energy-coupling factor transporter transmembrane protein EcfT
MHTTISGRHVAHQTVAALWIIAGIVAVIVLADAFALLALAIVITAWWILSAVEHHIERRQWESPGAGHANL